MHPYPAVRGVGVFDVFEAWVADAAGDAAGDVGVVFDDQPGAFVGGVAVEAAGHGVRDQVTEWDHVHNAHWLAAAAIIMRWIEGRSLMVAHLGVNTL